MTNVPTGEFSATIPCNDSAVILGTNKSLFSTRITSDAVAHLSSSDSSCAYFFFFVKKIIEKINYINLYYRNLLITFYYINKLKLLSVIGYHDDDIKLVNLRPADSLDLLDRS